MANTNKTLPTESSVNDFLNSITDEQRCADAHAINSLLQDVSGYTPTMWGTSIVGYGTYHYIYESGREGDSCIIGFSPRKNNFTLYLMGAMYVEQNKEAGENLLAKLGTFTRGKGCLYIKKLSDVDQNILAKLVTKSIKYVDKKYETR